MGGFVFAVVIALVFRSVAYEPFHIPSGCMLTTLYKGDYVFVSKLSYGYSKYSFPFGLVPITGRVFFTAPERGDVVVFKYPGMGKDDPDAGVDFVKRVVGLPGDRVEYRRGILTINGKRLAYQPVGQAPIPAGDGSPVALPGVQMNEQLGSHRHLVQNRAQSLEDGGMGDGEFEVPAGHYLMMGDNRDNSLDGRFWGPLPEANLRGKAFLVWMNFGDLSRIGERIP